MDIQTSYDFGKDCALNGPNGTNCNFGIFSKPEYTKAWEKGKKEHTKNTIKK